MSKKSKLYRLPDKTIVYLEMNSIKQILKDKGLDPGGDVQIFHTQNVLRRILRYMPYDSGMTIKVTIAQTNVRRPFIITNTPYARFLYHGKLMVSDVTGSPWARKGETKHAVDTPLVYTKTFNPKAGPYWDQALMAAEGAKLVSDLEDYLRRRRG